MSKNSSQSTGGIDGINGVTPVPENGCVNCCWTPTCPIVDPWAGPITWRMTRIPRGWTICYKQIQI